MYLKALSIGNMGWSELKLGAARYTAFGYDVREEPSSQHTNTIKEKRSFLVALCVNGRHFPAFSLRAPGQECKGQEQQLLVLAVCRKMGQGQFMQKWTVKKDAECAEPYRNAGVLAVAVLGAQGGHCTDTHKISQNQPELDQDLDQSLPSTTMPENPLESWLPRLPHIEQEQMDEGVEEQEEADAPMQPQRDDEHATTLPPAEWYAKWQEDKAKWEVERSRWQKERARCRCGSATSPLPSEGLAAPEAAILSPPEPEAKPNAGWRSRLWEKCSRRPPWKRITHLLPSVSHPNIHPQNDVRTPPSCYTGDRDTKPDKNAM
ncbi:hypothetical protein FB451DRAFT_1371557 [Mycena latifolia]|nr:hypothetical protein FB451DRAFT_1371557 [Mycena latifolia]